MADIADETEVIEAEEDVEEEDPKAGQGEEDGEPDDDGKDDDPPVRQSSNAFFARGRIIKKQQKALNGKEPKGEEEEGELELTPQARQLIEAHLAPVVKNLQSLTDQAELREYLADHPEHKKFTAAAVKRMQAWPNVPVAEIFKTLTYGQSAKAKDEEKRAAEEKARRGELKGSGARPDDEPGLPSTQEDMKKLYKRAKRGETIKLA